MAGRRQALEAARLLYRDRRRSAALATEVVRTLSDDVVATATAHRVLASVAVQEGDLAAAERSISAALDAALQSGDRQLRAEALMTRMGVHVLAGRPQLALEDARLAEPDLPPMLALRLRGQRAAVLATAFGRVREAIAVYGEVVEQFARAGAAEDEAVARNNRGLYLLHSGEPEAAWVDLALARDIFSQLGNDAAGVDCGWNLMLAAARLGDLPLVFAFVQDLERVGTPDDPRAALDLGHALMEVGLVDEAVAAEALAVELAGSRGPWAIEARQRLSEAYLQVGDHDNAVLAAEGAELAARSEGHAAWAALARITRALAEQARSGASPLYELMESEIDMLESAGWHDIAADCRLGLAVSALDSGAPDAARRLAGGATTAARRHHDTRGDIRAWHARAICRAVDGDRTGSLRAVGAAVRAISTMTTGIGSSDLRAAAARRRASLGELALQQCWDAGRPRQILAWAERLRATDLARAAGPRVGLGLGHDLAELRAVEMSNADPATKRFVRHHLERQIRTRARAEKATHIGVAGPPNVNELCSLLGEGTLVEFVAVERTYRALTVRRGRVQTAGTEASMAETEELISTVAGALRTMSGPGSGALTVQSVERLHTAAELLDRLLIQPLDLPDGPLVIVPTGGLNRLTWNALPTCQRRPVQIAPSAMVWVQCARRLTRPTKVVTIAGPDLHAAASEARSVAALYDHAAVLTGHDATVERVRAEMVSADLVHFAAHGTYRSDNPLLSSLALADGPLLVYDLEMATRLPSQLVLSACDLAHSRVLPGDEMLGLAASLYPRGVTTVIAANQPVDDIAASKLMVGYHRQLTAGLPPATALHRSAQSTRSTGDARLVAAAAAFGCHGAG